MRRLLLLTPFIIFLVLGAFFYKGLQLDPKARDSALLNKPLPEFSLPRLDNPDLLLTKADLIGSPLVINVWGSWCPSCYNEHPEIQRLAEAGVRVVGINYKDTRPAAFKYLTQLGNPYELNLYEPDGVRELAFNLGVYGAPETFLVDAQGYVRFHLAGELTAYHVDEILLPQVKQWQD